MLKTELLFCKSKVYLHPTTSKKDNVCGFLSLTRDDNAPPTDIRLNFTPEASLSLEELAIYEEVDVSCMPGQQPKKVYRVAKPSSGYYSQLWPLLFVYLIQFRQPSVGLWYGLIVVNTKDGNRVILFFHDDESPLTKQGEKQRNKDFDPFGSDGGLYWGGVDFKEALSKYINIAQSVEKLVWLVNPGSDDLRNFSPFINPPEDDKAKSSNTSTDAAIEFPDFGKMFTQAKWKVLETIATLGAKTRNNVIDLYDEHAPTPIKQLVKPEMITEFNDTTRVYLAKWAQQVKEEAEQNQMVLSDDIYRKIEKELGGEILTDEEISKTNRRSPICKQEWDLFFDRDGHLAIPISEVKERIFHGGLAPEVRNPGWLFLLGVYPWDLNLEERQQLRNSYELAYHDYKKQWLGDDELRATEYWRDQKHRIEKDVHRTDRQLDLFKRKKPNQTESRESSPETPDISDNEDEVDIANIANPHLYAMREILLTYNQYNTNLGYVQGMTDLLLPIYVEIRDESLVFWAFAKFMERMERNFLRDASGMKQQMLTLTQLLQFMLPQLYAHLEKCECSDLFFFFRMLLVWFKRELKWNQIGPLWETLWTDYYSSQYHLFVALAILLDNERIIRQNLVRFDEVLKYMNDLALSLNINTILIRAELLFLKFRRMVDIIDRENSLRLMNALPYQRESGQVDTVTISDDLRRLLSKDMVIQKEGPRPEGALGG